MLSSPYFPTPFAYYAYSVRSFTSWVWARLAWLDAAFERVALEAESALASGQNVTAPLDARTAVAIMNATVQDANAAAARAQQLGGLVGMGTTWEAWHGVTTEGLLGAVGGHRRAGGVGVQGAGGAPAASLAAAGPKAPQSAEWGWQALLQQQQQQQLAG